MSKSNQLADILSKNMDDLKRTAFISLIRNRPETTLAEVAEYIEAESMDQITIGDIIDGDLGEKHSAPVAPPARTGKGKGKGKGKKKKPERLASTKVVKPLSDGEVNTRSKEGRAAYAAAVLACIQKDGAHRWSAREVREKVGGTANQVRRALATHIEDKNLTWDGNARATVYFLPV
jgi:predicted RNA-binding protein YlxR (DUF448 family)